jgi:phosphate transport system substrate-binding protein
MWMPSSFSVCSTMALAAVFLLCGCSSESSTGNQSSTESTLIGSISIDGSSTVYPITAAVAEEFQKQNRKTRISVAYSGTGGGFKKFDAGEIDINNASRPISKSEIEKAAANGVEFIELPVAYDGLTIIVSPQNDWVDHITTEELKQIWEPTSTVKMWSDVRPTWPNEPFQLFGAGTDSGTFDYFTEAIMGKSGSCRSDYTATEDDNLTVQGVSGNKYALGFLGIAYFNENTDKLRALPVKHGDLAPVEPTLQTVMTNTYAPLSRPLFIYVRNSSTQNPAVDAFVQYYLRDGAELVQEVGYIPLPEKAYELVMKRYTDRVLGTAFVEREGGYVGMSIEQLLAQEAAHK